MSHIEDDYWSLDRLPVTSRHTYDGFDFEMCYSTLISTLIPYPLSTLQSPLTRTLHSEHLYVVSIWAL